MRRSIMNCPLYGYFKDGGSTLWVGEAMRERTPGTSVTLSSMGG